MENTTTKNTYTIKRTQSRRNPMDLQDKNFCLHSLGKIVFFKDGIFAQPQENGRIENELEEGLERRPEVINLKGIPQKKNKIDLENLKDGYFILEKLEFSQNARYSVYLEADSIETQEIVKYETEEEFVYHIKYTVLYNGQKYIFTKYSRQERKPHGLYIQEILKDFETKNIDINHYQLCKLLKEYTLTAK